jgi:predicted nucleotidyltransferase
MGRTKHIVLLKKFKKDLTKHITIQRMILFGSRAHGKATRWSDFDLLIVSPKFDGVKFRYRPIGFYQYWTLNYPVDFLCYSPKEFRELSKRISIVSQALKEGVEI